MNDPKSARYQQELIEGACILCIALFVVGVGCVLWQWVSPWAIVGWAAINVLFVVWRVRIVMKRRRINRWLETILN